MKNNKFNESLVKSHLLMKYDTKKTLTENKILITEIGPLAITLLVIGGTALVTGLVSYISRATDENPDAAQSLRDFIVLGEKAYAAGGKITSGYDPSGDAVALYTAMFDNDYIFNFGATEDEETIIRIITSLTSVVDLAALNQKYKLAYRGRDMVKDLEDSLQSAEWAPITLWIEKIQDQLKAIEDKVIKKDDEKTDDQKKDDQKTDDQKKDDGEKIIPVPKPVKKWIEAPSCEEVSKGNAKIEKGMRGTCVGTIQKKLNEVNQAGLSEDEKFGSLTKKAVESFQTKNSITANGIVDKITYDKLFSADQSIEVDNSSIRMENKTKKSILKENASTPYNLSEFIQYGCFDRITGTGKTLKSYEKQVKNLKNGKRAVMGQGNDGNYYFFYEDGKYDATNQQGTKYTIIKSGNFNCPVNKYKTEQETQQNTAQQNDFITKLKQQYPTYETRDDVRTMELKVKKGEYKKIDLNDYDPNLFPEKNKYFVYEKTLSQTSYQKEVIDSYTANTNYKIIDCNYPLTDNLLVPIIDLSEVNNGKYSKIFAKGQTCMSIMRNKENTLDTSDWEKFLSADSTLGMLGQANLSKKFCRDLINKYSQAMDRNLPVSNQNVLSNVKQTIKSCGQQHQFVFGTKNDLEKILYSRANRYGKYALKESDLSKIIKTNLMEIQDKKKSFITESKIVKNRLELLKETIGKSKNNRRLVFYTVVNEIKILKNQGISDKVISEQFEALFNALGGFFGKPGVQSTIGGGIGGTFVEYAVQFLIKALGLPTDGPIAQLFITAMGNVGSFENIPRMLTECDFTAELLAKSIVEAIGKNFVDDYIGSGILSDLLRNTLTDAAFSTDMVKGIQSKISGKVCEIIGNLGDKAGEKAKEMKEKALS